MATVSKRRLSTSSVRPTFQRSFYCTKILVKILVGISVLASVSVRWTLMTTQTALERALHEFVVEKNDEHVIKVLSSSSSSMLRAERQSNRPVFSTRSMNHTEQQSQSHIQNQGVTQTNDFTSTHASVCNSLLLQQRSLQRIPAYIQGCDHSSFYGYVMRDLSNRFLYRQRQTMASTFFNDGKTVVVVTDHTGARTLNNIRMTLSDPFSKTIREELIRKHNYQVPSSFMIDALWNNHTLVVIDRHDDDYAKHSIDGVDFLLLDMDQYDESSYLSPTTRQIIASETTRFAVFQISSTKSRRNMSGLDICRHFLLSGYKLQILSSSHVYDGVNPYPPNLLFKGLPQIEMFLQHGINLTTENNGERFQSYLFATRGWELAIPSRKEYINMTGLGNDHVIDVQQEGIPFRRCPPTGEDAKISISKTKISISKTKMRHRFEISCFGSHAAVDSLEIDQNTTYTLFQKQDNSQTTKINAQIWTGHHDVAKMEATCVKCTKQRLVNTTNVSWQQKSACMTQARSTQSETTADYQKHANKNNLLAIQVKGLGRQQLRQSLPSLQYVLSHEILGLTSYPNFFGLEDENFSPLPGKNNDSDLPRIWLERGYQVYHSTTKCHGNIPRNSSSSIDDPYHGRQIQQMFCFDHEHPHCLAGLSKPKLLLNSVEEFIQLRQHNTEQWAVFVTFSEGADDETRTLVDTLDIPLTNFLSSIARQTLSSEEWSRTTVAIFSDEVKDDNPVLYLKVGGSGSTTKEDQGTSLTPLDLAMTIGQLAKAQSNDTIETSQLKDSSSQTVSTFDNDVEYQESVQISEEDPTTPSILSFYADIPKERKIKLHIDTVLDVPHRATVRKGCLCATNTQTWFPCEAVHPWAQKEDYREYFILVDCPEKATTHLEVRLLPNDVLLKRSRAKRELSGYANVHFVNVLFLEIDSVSQQYADRHFPKTRELLRKYRVRKNKETGEYSCKFGICSAEFSGTSLVGANSIPNQVAALAGCLSTTTNEMCGLQQKSIGEICNDTDQPHYGLRLERVRASGEQAYWCQPRDTAKLKTPWLFGVLDDRGYINFFGEEFCYESSPYVTQGNVFTKFYQDIESHHVFCRLAERRIMTENLTISANQRWGVDLPGPCVDGSTCSRNTEKSSISLQFLQNMWETYTDAPKFAFLNAIAAHDYSFNWEQMTGMAERYDEYLSEFLRGMLSRKDSESTVIVLRSDHGLQRGPTAMDYSLQSEHRRPWTEILVPEGLIVSKSALDKNQNRMSTGFDLYNTIRAVISRNGGIIDDEAIPNNWSYDLLSDEIPHNRSCKEARVDPELCRKIPVPRSYGVCNRLDPKQAFFCSSPRDKKDW